MKQPLRAIVSFSPLYPSVLDLAIGRDGGTSRRQRPAIEAAGRLFADLLPAPLSATFLLHEASVGLRVHNHAARTDFSWGSGNAEREGPLAAGLCAALESAGIERRGTLALADWAIRRYLFDVRPAPLSRADHAIAVAAIQDLRAPILAYLCPGSSAEARSWDFLVAFHSRLDPLSVALVSRLVHGLHSKTPVRTAGLFLDERSTLATEELQTALDGLRGEGLIGAVRTAFVPPDPGGLWEFSLEPGPAAEGLLAKDLLTPPRPFGLSPLRQIALDPIVGRRHLCAVNVGRSQRDGRLLASACPVTVCRHQSATGWPLAAGPANCPDCLAAG